MIRSPLRSPLNPVLSAIGNRRRPTGINPAKLFASGEPGLWYAPRDMATGFQDTDATTPITAVEQFVGRRNDKSGRGNHVLQATATARPTLSARVNLLTKTEDLGVAPWVNVQGASSYVGGKIVPAATTLIHGRRYSRLLVAGRKVTASAYVKAGEAGVNLEFWNYISVGAVINLTTWVVTGVTNCTVFLGDFDGDGYRMVSFTFTEEATTSNNMDFRVTRSTLRDQQFVGDGSSGYFLKKLQVEIGAVATTYQRVNTATDYDEVGVPLGDKFDGIDDGLVTATFAAGTLTSNMDCFVALRRDSDAKVISAYKSAGDSSAYFAAMESAAGTAANAGSGSLTYAVNGVAVAGGTATTRGQLHTAVPVGPWAIIEMRNMDLSSWTSFGFGAYTTFLLNGAIAEIILCPAQSDATRTAIRKYMAKNVGVTL